MPIVSRRKFWPIVRAIMSIVVLAALSYRIGSVEIVAHVRAVSWEAVVGATLILATSVFLVTPRWALILSVFGFRTSWKALMSSVFLGFLFNQLLPTAVGGDALRVWRATQLGAPWETAIYSVLLDRASGVLISLVGAAVLLPLGSFHAGQGRLEWLIAIVAGLLGFGLVIMWALSLIHRMPISLLAGIHAWLVRLHDKIWAFSRRPGATAAVVVLATLNQLLPVAAILIFAREMGISLPALDLALITFISTLAATVPISIAGWGIREGALVYLFGLYGVLPDTAFAVSILFGIALTLSSTPGTFFVLRVQSKPPSAKIG